MNPRIALRASYTSSVPMMDVCFDPATLTAITVISAIAGSAVSAAGTIAGGNAQAQQLQQQGLVDREAADFEAKQLAIRANEEFAAGQQEASQLRRQKNLALSSLQARSAGSGFSATDSTALALGDEIAEYGTLQEQLALFGGEARQRNLRERAAAARFSGESSASARFAEASSVRRGSRFSAFGTILGGVSSAAGKFAGFSGGSSTSSNFRYGSNDG